MAHFFKKKKTKKKNKPFRQLQPSCTKPILELSFYRTILRALTLEDVVN